MKIQMLTFSGAEKSFRGDDVEIRKIHDAVSFDVYDINIINLQDQNLWKYKGDGWSIDSKNDFINVAQWIETSNKSKIVILLPQNYVFKYKLHYDKYKKSCEIKNMLEALQNKILVYMFPQIEEVKILYENNSTKLENIIYSSAFKLQDVKEEDVLTKSVGSNSITTARIEKVVLSALLLNANEDIMRFVKELQLIPEEEPPAWMQNIKMFDDNLQLNVIQEKKQIISEQQSIIEEAKAVLSKNARYESILYTNGNKLVTVVVDILQEIMGCDLSGFVDEKNEDFRFKIGDRIFIGEIKGAKDNVKRQHVSQLDNHVKTYLDDHEDDEENIVALLVINHQRKKPIEDREPVHKNQIKLAEDYNILIIETRTLLKLFERYWAGEIDRETCIELLSNKKGILEV